MSQSAPHNLLRLSFDTHDDYRAYWKANAKMQREIWLWHETTGDKAEPFEIPGLCDICECLTAFDATPQESPDGRFRHRVAWWSRLLCGCKRSTLDRAAMRAVLESGKPDDKIYHVGHFSEFRLWLSEKMPNVTASQYEENRKPGEIENSIRYESLTELSFADAEFDTTVCMEVLEHIPDYHKALREMARTLKIGGRAILSFPWLGGEYYDHRIRAELLPDGSINHILPPEYHGDPASKEKILSFRAFGWKILDEIRAAGFSKASANYLFGPLHGHMQLSTPIIIAER